MHPTACHHPPFLSAGPFAGPSTGRRGVGLVEMMLSVVLVCLIATVAIPQLLAMHRKAMRAEILPNLRAIGMAEQAWFASEASWIAAGPNPVPPVDRSLRDFDRERTDWMPLAWYPEGQVRCSYSTTILDRGLTVRADALCDLDADQRMVLLRFEVPRAKTPGVFLDLYPERF